jgi:hypothetical protein
MPMILEYNIGDGAAYVAFVAPNKIDCSGGDKHTVMLGYLCMADDWSTMVRTLMWARIKDPQCVVIWIRCPEPEPQSKEVLQ